MVNHTEKTRPNSLEESTNILQKAPLGILTFDEEYRINFVNEIFSSFGIYYNFNHDNLTGQSILDSDIFPGLSLKEDLLDIQNGYSFEREYTRVETGSAVISLIIKCAPVFEEQNFQGGILVVEDLKILKGITETGILKTEHFEKIINRINDLLFITDDEGIVKFYYGKQVRKLNYEITNNFRINNIFSPSVRNDFDKYYELVKAKRHSEKFNIELVVEENKLIYECRIEPLLNKKGQIQFIFFFLEDITEIFQSDKNLTKQLNDIKQYQSIAESMAESLIAIDLEGKIILWNRASEILFGYSKNEVAGNFLEKH